MTNSDDLEIGRNALAVGAWEEAKDALQKAVGKNPSPEVLEELSWANWWLNDMAVAFDLREKAHFAFLARKDRRGASRMASWLGLDNLEYNGAFAVANGWFQRAESLLEGEPACKERCTINTLKANLSFRVDRDIPRALRLLDDTIAMSKSIDDIECLMLAEGLKGFVLVSVGRVKEGMQLLDEATVLALGRDSGDIHTVTVTCCFLIDACQRVRDFDRAGQWCVKVKEICRRWRHRAVFATCRTQYASVLVSRGEWAEAEEELTNAIQELKLHKPASVQAGIIRLADLRRRQGRLAEAKTLFEGTKTGTKSPPFGALLYDIGEYRPAFDLAERLLRQISEDEKTERVAALELLVQSSVRLDRLSVAESGLSELESIAAHIALPPFQAACLYAKALICSRQGEYDLSRQRFEDAIDIYEQLASPYEVGRAKVALAKVLEAQQKWANAEKELSEAAKIFHDLGAERDLQLAQQSAREIGHISHDLKGFTKREIKIIKMVAAGKSNQEIGDELFISLRTVEKHLSNIYQKLGISGKSARAYTASFAGKISTP